MSHGLEIYRPAYLHAYHVSKKRCSHAPTNDSRLIFTSTSVSISLYIVTYLCIYIHISVYINMYLHIYRERETHVYIYLCILNV